MTNQQWSSIQGPTYVIQNKEEIASLGQWSAGTAFKKSIRSLQDSNSKESDMTYWGSLSCVNVLDMSSGNVLNLLWTCHLERHLWSFELWVPCLYYVLRIEAWVASGNRNILQNVTNYVNLIWYVQNCFEWQCTWLGVYCICWLLLHHLWNFTYKNK